MQFFRNDVNIAMEEETDRVNHRPFLKLRLRLRIRLRLGPAVVLTILRVLRVYAPGLQTRTGDCVKPNPKPKPWFRKGPIMMYFMLLRCAHHGMKNRLKSFIQTDWDWDSRHNDMQLIVAVAYLLQLIYLRLWFM